MSFLYGVIGTLVTILVIGIAFAGGWFAHSKFSTPKLHEHTYDEKAEIEKERKKLIDQQNAFHVVQNYSVERAYGMLNDTDGVGGDNIN